MANQILARLGVVLGLNVAEWQRDVDQAIAANSKLKREIKQNSNAAEKEIEKLTYAVKDFGKELTNAERVEREFISGGKYAQATQSRKDQLLIQARALDAVTAASKNAQKEQLKSAGLNAQQLQALSYQTTDIFTSLAGGQSPLLVLIQQGGQLKDQFGGITNVFKAFASVLTPLRVGLGAVATIIGSLGYAFYKANEDQKEFNSQLALSGGIAGITYGKFLEMSQGIAKSSGITVGSAKDIGIAMVSSGQLFGQSMESVGKAIGLTARLSGEAANEVAKTLVPAFTSGASAVFALDQKTNFLTLTQYRQIENLQKLGDFQGIATLASEAYTNHLKDAIPELSLYAKAINFVSDAWDKLKQAVTPKTKNEQLDDLKKQLALLETVRDGLLPRNELTKTGFVATDENIKTQIEKVRAAIKQFEDQSKADQEKNIEDIRQKKLKAAFAIAGGESALNALVFEKQMAASDLQFERDVFNTDKLTRIRLDGEKKVRQLNAERTKDIKNAGSSQLHMNAINEKYDLKVKAAQQESKQKRQEAILEERKGIEDNIRATQLQIDQEQEKLSIYKNNINASEEDIQKAMTRLAFEKQIKDIRASRVLDEGQQSELIAQIAMQNAQKAYTDGQLKALITSRDTVRVIQDRQKTEKDALQLEEEKLAIYSANLLISDKDLNIALSRLKTEQEIERIQKQQTENKLTAEGASLAIEEERRIQQKREGIIQLSDNLKVLQDVNRAVFNDMEAAIMNFVKTGKMSFKDLAKSIIQDIIAIHAKAQAAQLFNMASGFLKFAFNSMTGSSMPAAIMPKASGGGVAANEPYMIGENGPELFIPRNSGTIIPHQGMSQAMGNTPSVVYNGPYIASMTAIDTQSATQFLARNKLAVWSANQSASRSLPASR